MGRASPRRLCPALAVRVLFPLCMPLFNVFKLNISHSCKTVRLCCSGMCSLSAIARAVFLQSGGGVFQAGRSSLVTRRGLCMQRVRSLLVCPLPAPAALILEAGAVTKSVRSTSKQCAEGTRRRMFIIQVRANKCCCSVYFIPLMHIGAP